MTENAPNAGPIASPEGAASTRRTLFWLVAIALGLRFFLLADKPLWTDEASRLVWAHGQEKVSAEGTPAHALGPGLPLRGLRGTLEVSNRHTPPVVEVSLNLWLRAVGSESDFNLRIPFALLSALAVLAAFLFGREAGGDKAGLGAAALVAFSSFHVEYAQEVNHYPIVTLLAGLSYWLHLRFLRSAKAADGALYALAGIAGLYTHYYFLLALASQGLGSLPGALREPRRAVRLLWPWATVLAAFVPYLGHLKYQLAELASDANSGAFGGVGHALDRLGQNLLAPWLGELSTRVPTVPALLCVLGLAVLVVLGTRQAPAPLRTALLLYVVVPTLLIFSAYFLQRKNTVLWPRYGLLFTSALFVPVALFWSRLPRRASALAAAFAAVVLSSGLWYYYFVFEKEDWRSAAHAIDRTAEPGDPVLVFQPSLVYELAHYLRGDTRLTSVPFDPGPARALARKFASAPGALYFVVGWKGESPIPDLLLGELACARPKPGDLSSRQVQVLRFPPAGSGPLPPGCGLRADFTPPAGGCALSAEEESLPLSGTIDLPSPEARLSLFSQGQPLVEATLEPILGAPPESLRRRFTATLPLRAPLLRAGEAVPVTARLQAPGAALVEAGPALLCMRRPPAIDAPQPGAARHEGWLDPVASALVGARLEVGGWAFDSRGVAAVRLLVDGKEVALTRQHGLSRPDVAGAFPSVPQPLAARSGFIGTLETAGLGPGPHTLTAQTQPAAGEPAQFGPPRGFTLLAK